VRAFLITGPGQGTARDIEPPEPAVGKVVEVEPGGRVVCIGLSGEPSLLDTRVLVLTDVTAVGVLSASGGIEETISLYASGTVDPRLVVAATTGLDEIATVLSGRRQPGWGDAPKIHVDPRR
jgi:threonine dehydrogenase-like Zn-dependent dehydrogenase